MHTIQGFMDVQKFRADQRKQRAASQARVDEGNRKYYESRNDPRDNAKFGAVVGSRPYSTGSKHGTGRGSQA